MRRFTKVWVLFLVLVIALAGVGVGFAHWSQTLTIDSTVNTGTLTVGIRDMGTNDPSAGHPAGGIDPACDPDVAPWPCPCSYYPAEGGAPPNGKDVARTDSYQGTYKCSHGDPAVSYYHDITLVFDNVYPSYCPCVKIAIANCGSVPADLDIGDIVEIEPVIGADLRPWMDPVCGSVTMNGVSIDPSEWTGQLDPCQVLEICVCFHFLQVNAAGELLPEGASMTSEVTLTFTQWNAP